MDSSDYVYNGTIPTQIFNKLLVNVRITTDKTVESKYLTVPVILNTIKVNYFPEGGPLIAGVPNRVYFESLLTFDQPSEFKA